MKTVFENSMVAHVWNAQSQSAGRSGNGNFYFNDSMLFSYRDSWIVAKIMPDGVALLNSDTYSISTSRHSRYAWNACSNRTYYGVPELSKLLRDELNATRVRSHLLDNAKSISDDSACYLLALVKVKNPANAWTRIKTERARLDLAEKESSAKSKLDSQLRDASNVAAMDDSQVNEYLARACNRSEIKKVSTVLFHAHRAAKKRKRNVQASRVYDVLILARKIIALDEKKQRAKERLRSFSSLRDGFERSLEQFNANPSGVSSQSLRRLADCAESLLHLVPVRSETRNSLALISHYAEIAVNERREIEEAAELARTIAEKESWLRGDRSARVHYTYGVTLLRALDVTRDESGKITGGTLQTSRNAEVPLVHAIRAFRFVKLCKENGRAWTRNGHALRVGHFAIDSINASGDFVAGCHNIKWSEVERVARALGVFDCPASDSALTPSHEAA